MTRWTVRGAVSLYLLALVVRYCAAGSPDWLRTARWFWTAGYVALLIHVFCAFQFFHHWSHAAAYAATARQTEQVVGLNWGGGLYVNYAFMAVWGADVVWWWLNPRSYERRHAAIEWTVQLFLAFIIVNATVVF